MIKKLLFITHQLSETGAPFCLIELAKECLRFGYIVEFISYVDGELTKELERFDIPYTIMDRLIEKRAEFRNFVGNYDLVIANTLVTYEVIHLLNKTKIPTIWWIHEGENYFSTLELILPNFNKLSDNIKIFSVSRKVQNIIKNRYNVETEVLLPKISDYPMDKIEKSDNTINFLSVGTVSYVKGTDILVSAIEGLTDEMRKKSNFLIVGGYDERDGGFSENLSKRIDKIEEISVRRLNREELKKYYEVADYILVPSRSETLSLVTIEGMQHSKPCIVSNSTGISYYLNDGEDSIIIEGEGELRKAIEWGIENIDSLEYDDISKAARKKYEQLFMGDIFSRKLRKTLEEMLPKKRLVSIIIPCFNVAKYLPKCFLSLVNQSIGIRNIELIFVDDASDDNGETIALLYEIEKTYQENIMVISLEENRKQGGARNVGLMYATGEYIAFVDADDFVAENFLYEAVSKAKEYDADIVTFGHTIFNEKANIEVKKDKFEVISLRNAEDRKKFLVSEKLDYGCWNKLYKTKLVKEAGVRFAEGVVYEEPLFVYPLLFFAKKVLILNESYYYYRQNDFGTMRKYMENPNTIFEHSRVQEEILDFMMELPEYMEFFDEIKLYFLHTYIYETLLFAKKRGYNIKYEDFTKLIDKARSHYQNLEIEKYRGIVPVQAKLFKRASEGMSKLEYEEMLEELR